MVFLWRVNDNQFILAGPISSDTFARRTKNLLEGVHVAYFQNGNVYESPENSGLGCQIGNLSFRLVTSSNEHLAFEILKRDPRHA